MKHEELVKVFEEKDKSDVIKSTKNKYKRVKAFVEEQKTLDFEDVDKALEKFYEKFGHLGINTQNQNFNCLAHIIGRLSGSQYLGEKLIKKSVLHQKYLDKSKKQKAQIQEAKKEKPRKVVKVEVIKTEIDKPITYAQFLYNLYSKYPPLRGDYCDVKLKNFEIGEGNYYNNGKIYFHDMLKNENNLVITLDETDTKFLEDLKTKQDLLFETNRPDKKGKADHFCKTLMESSHKVCKVYLGVAEFRRSYATKIITDVTEKLKETGNILEFYDSLKSTAKQMNTSIEQLIKSYMGEF